MVATAAVAAEALVEVDEVVGGGRGGKVAAKVAEEVMLVGSELENSNSKSTMGVDNS